MFALQIGSLQQLPSCNVQLDGDRSDGKVLLQYSRNKVILFICLLFVCISVVQV